MTEPDPKAGPPRPASRLLARALRHDPAGPAILGDLHEEYVRRLRTRGRAAAALWYWREALGLTVGRIARRAAGRSGDGLRPLHATARDAAFALRTLRRDPGFALFTALVIGLGVGASTTVYSVLRPLVLAPLPFEDPEELVWIENEAAPDDASLSAVTSRTANLHDFRERVDAFDALTGYDAFFRETAYTLTGPDAPARLVGVGVAHDFLDVLGVEPLLGRSFTAAEGRVDGPPAAILSHGLWTRRFGADEGLVGRTVTLNGTPRTVVGILPPSFDFASVFEPGTRVDLLLPFPIRPAGEGGFQGNRIFMVGRLAPGVTVASAASEIDAVLRALGEEQPDRWGLGAEIRSLRDHVAGPLRSALLLLAAAAATLLLVVCVNVSNLLLARMPGRAREVAVRKALGASRGRIVRQLVFESLAIALVGAGVGTASAWGATRVVAATRGVDIPMLDRVTLDPGALLFAVAVAAVTGVVVGLVPALRVGEGSEAAAIRAGGAGGGPSRGTRRFREALVVTQVALVCVLLVVAGLLGRSVRAVLDVDLGFDPADVLVWRLDPARELATHAERAAFFTSVVDRVDGIAGVESVGLVDAAPLDRNRSWVFSVVGESGEEPGREVQPHIVGPGYLATLDIPLLAGRSLTGRETDASPPVVMMNETGARRVFGSRDAALGRRVSVWGPWEWEVVGVVGDTRHLSPEIGPGIQLYFPIGQMPDFRSVELVVRSDRPPGELAPAVGAALRTMDPGMATREFRTLRSRIDHATSARRFTLTIVGAYGAAALFLAGLGIYGVLAHSVGRRRSEIGIRMALGASAGTVVRSVLERTLLLAGAGIVAGGAISVGVVGLLDSLRFGVGSHDLVTFAGMAGVLMLVATVAAALPAARAARVRGVGALQAE